MSNANQKNKITKLALLAGIVVAAAFAFGTIAASPGASGQVNSGSQAADDDDKNVQPSTISTAGSADTKVQPDMYSVTAGVVTNGTTAQQAVSLNANLMQQVISALEKIGIYNSSISTSNFDVSPIYSENAPAKLCPQVYPYPPQCEPGQVIVGYRASNSITVTLGVQSKIDPGMVVDTAVGAGANNINNAYFFISQERQQQIRDSLIKDAIANARERADTAASAIGMQVSGVQSVNLNDVYFPVYSVNYPSAKMAEMNAPTPIVSGPQDVSTTVNIVYYLSGGGTVGTAGEVPGMTRTINNTHCTNPPQGPMIC